MLTLASAIEAREAQIYQLVRKDPEKPHSSWLIRDEQRGLAVFQGNGHGPGVDSYWLVQGDRRFRVLTEYCGHSGPEKKTIHLRIYDGSLRDELGALVEGEEAADLKTLILEGIDSLIRLRSPNVIETVDVKFGPWIPQAPAATPPLPVPFRMPWAELAAFVVGLAIAAAWIGAELHVY